MPELVTREVLSRMTSKHITSMYRHSDLESTLGLTGDHIKRHSSPLPPYHPFNHNCVKDLKPPELSLVVSSGNLVGVTQVKYDLSPTEKEEKRVVTRQVTSPIGSMEV